MTRAVTWHVRAAMLFAAVSTCGAVGAAEPENVLRAQPPSVAAPSAGSLRQPASLRLPGGGAEPVEPTLYCGTTQESNPLRFRRATPEERLPLPERSAALLSEPNPFPADESAKALAAAAANASDRTTKSAALVTKAAQLASCASSREQLTNVMRLCKEATDEDSASSQAEYAVRLAAWAANRRGELTAAGGDERAALADFQRAIAIDPDCWQAIHNRGVSHAVRGDHSAALADFNQAIDLNPRFSSAYRNRGELRCEVGLVREAIDDYSHAIRLAPDDDELRRIRGHAHHRLGHYVAAVQDLNEAIRLNPKNAAAFNDRGNIYAELGYYRQALTDYHQALRLDGEYAPAYRSTAWVLATCPDDRYRRPEKALIAAHRAVAYAPTVDPLALDALAAAQASAGQFQEAVATQSQAIELAGDGPLAAGLRARFNLYRAGKSFRATPSDANLPPSDHRETPDHRQTALPGPAAEPPATTHRPSPRGGSRRFPARRSLPLGSGRSQ